MQPRTLRQVANRTLLSLVSQGWRGLSDADKLAWANYAADHPRTDSLGQSIVLSGSQAYIGVGIATITSGLGLPTIPPAYPEPSWDLNIITSWASAAGSIEAAHGVIPADTALVIYASPPRSPGVAFNADYRVIASISAGIAGTSDVSVQYGNVFGTPPDGSLLFLRAKQISNQGWRGPDLDAQLTFNA